MRMDTTRSDRPLVYASRIDPASAAPGTVDAFDQAEADGADGLSLEVRLTGDGEVVVLADPDVLISGRRVPVSSLTLLELLGTAPGEVERSRPIPLLREVLSRYGGDLRTLVELKPGVSSRPGLLEHRVAALLTQHNALGRSICLSGSAETLRRLRDAQPAIVTGLLLEGALPAELPAGARSVAVPATLAESYLAVARPLGIAVHALGLSVPEDACRLAAAGVASLVTNRPADVRRALAAG